MEYNKNYFSKINDKKILHKVKKQWVVVSAALLMAIGGGALATQTAHASANSNNTNHANMIKNQLNQKLQQPNKSTQPITSEIKPKFNNINNINQQANNLHQHILNSAQLQKNQPKSAENQQAYNIKTSQSNSISNYVNNINHQFKNTNNESQNTNTYVNSISQKFQSNENVTKTEIHPKSPQVGDTDPGNSIIHARVTNARHPSNGGYETDYSDGTIYYSDGNAPNFGIYPGNQNTSITNLVFNNEKFYGPGHAWSCLPNLKTVTFEGNIQNYATFVDNDFEDDYNLTHIYGLNKFLNTKTVQDYTFLFKNCHSLQSVDFSTFDTTNVPKSGETTADPSDPNVPSLDDGNAFAFKGCDGLDSITLGPKTVLYKDSGLSGFVLGKSHPISLDDGHNHVGTHIFFKADQNGNWNQAQWHFDSHNGILVLGNADGSDKTITDNKNDASGLDWSKVQRVYTYNIKAPISMGWLFSGLPHLQIFDGSGINVSDTNDIDEMFAQDKGLQEINLPWGQNTRNIWNMRATFQSDGLNSPTGQTIIDGLSDWNTQSVTSLSWLFWNARVNHINLSKWNTNRLSQTLGMFMNNPILSDVNLGGSFNTTHVSDMSGMFDNDTGLKYLDLSNFDTNHAMNISHFWNDDIFPNNPSGLYNFLNGTQNLSHIKLGNNTKLDQYTYLGSKNPIGVVNLDNHSIVPDLQDRNSHPGNWRVAQGIAYITLKFGSQTLATNQPIGIFNGNIFASDLKTSTNGNNYEFDPRLSQNIPVINNNHYTIQLDETGKWNTATWDLTPNSDINGQGIQQYGTNDFYLHDGQFTNNRGNAGNVDWSKVQHIDTHNVWSSTLRPEGSQTGTPGQYGVFDHMPNLQTVDLTGVDASNINDQSQIPRPDRSIDISNIVQSDTKLSDIKFSPSFDADHIGTGASFNSDYALKYIDISMFKSDTIFGGIDAPNLHKITLGSDTILDSNGLVNGPYGYNVSNPNNIQSIDNGQPHHAGTWVVPAKVNDTIQYHNIYNGQTNNLTNPSNTVSNDLYNLPKTISAPNGWTFVDNNDNPIGNQTFTADGNTHTYNIAPIYAGLTYKFYNSPQGKVVEFEKGQLSWQGDNNNNSCTNSFIGGRNKFNVPNGIDDANVIKFDSGVDVSKVTQMDNMIAWDYNVHEIDLGNNFKTSQVTDMNRMFNSDLNLATITGLDNPNFNTSNVNDMSCMFYSDSDLQSLNLGSNFDTSKAKNNMGGILNTNRFNKSNLRTITIQSPKTVFANNVSFFHNWYQINNANNYNPGNSSTVENGYITPINQQRIDNQQSHVGTWTNEVPYINEHINYQWDNRSVGHADIIGKYGSDYTLNRQGLPSYWNPDYGSYGSIGYDGKFTFGNGSYANNEYNLTAGVATEGANDIIKYILPNINFSDVDGFHIQGGSDNDSNGGGQLDDPRLDNPSKYLIYYEADDAVHNRTNYNYPLLFLGWDLANNSVQSNRGNNNIIPGTNHETVNQFVTSLPASGYPSDNINGQPSQKQVLEQVAKDIVNSINSKISSSKVVNQGTVSGNNYQEDNNPTYFTIPKDTTSGLPTNYHLINANNYTFNYDNGNHYVDVAPNQITLHYINNNGQNGNANLYNQSNDKIIDTTGCITNNYTLHSSDVPTNYSLTSNQSITIPINVLNRGTVNINVTPNKVNEHIEFKDGNNVISSTTKNGFYGHTDNISAPSNYHFTDNNQSNHQFTYKNDTDVFNVTQDTKQVTLHFTNWLTGSDITGLSTPSIKLSIGATPNEKAISDAVLPILGNKYHLEQSGNDSKGTGLNNQHNDKSKTDYLKEYLNTPSNTITKNTSTLNIPVLPSGDTHYGYLGDARYAYNPNTNKAYSDDGNNLINVGTLNISGFTGRYNNNNPIDGAQLAPYYDVLSDESDNGYLNNIENSNPPSQLIENLNFIDNVKAPQYCTAERVSDSPNPVSKEAFSDDGTGWLPASGNYLRNINLKGLDTSTTLSMSGMFDGLSTLYSDSSGLDINFGSNFKTSDVQNMSNMFANNQNIHNITLGSGSSFNTSNVKDMYRMFGEINSTDEGHNFNNVSINLGGNFNTHNVKNMGEMFDECYAHHIEGTSKFDTSNVKNMSSMFSDFHISDLNLNQWNNFDTSNVSDMSLMFKSDSDIHLNLGNKFNTSNVKYMDSMFYGADSGNKLHNLNLGNKFNTKKVTSMSDMFANNDFTSIGTSNSDDLNLGPNFDTSNVTNMASMFSGNQNLQHLSLGDKFNTSNATNIDSMFSYEPNLHNLNLGEKFDTSKVTDMSGMFSNSNYTSIGFSNNDDVNLGPNFNTDANPLIGVYFKPSDGLINYYDSWGMHHSDVSVPERMPKSAGMFASDKNLVHVDLSHLINVRSPVGLFSNDKNIRDINLKNMHVNDASDKNNPYIYYDALLYQYTGSPYSDSMLNSDLTSITLNSSDKFLKDNNQDPHDPLDNYNNYLNAYRGEGTPGTATASDVEISDNSGGIGVGGDYHPNLTDGTWFQITPNGLHFLRSDSSKLETGLHDNKSHPGTWFRDRGVNSVIYIDQHGHVIYPSHYISNHGNQMNYTYNNQNVKAGNNRKDFVTWLNRQSLPHGFHLSGQTPRIYTKKDEQNSEIDYIGVVQVIGDNSSGTQNTLAKFYDSDNQGHLVINKKEMQKTNGLASMHYSGRIDDTFTNTISDYSDIPSDNGTFVPFKVTPNSDEGTIVANPLGKNKDINNYSSTVKWNSIAPTVSYKYVNKKINRTYKEKVMYQECDQNGVPIALKYDKNGNPIYELSLNNGQRYTYGQNTTVNLSDVNVPNGYTLNRNGNYLFGEASQKSGRIDIDNPNVTPDKLAGETNVISVPITGNQVKINANIIIGLNVKNQTHYVPATLHLTGQIGDNDNISDKSANITSSDTYAKSIGFPNNCQVTSPSDIHEISIVPNGNNYTWIQTGNWFNGKADNGQNYNEPLIQYNVNPVKEQVIYINQNGTHIQSDNLKNTYYHQSITQSDILRDYPLANDLKKGYSIDKGQVSPIIIKNDNIYIYVLGNKAIKDIKFVDETNDNQPLSSDEYNLNGTNSIGDTISDIKIPSGYTIDKNNLPDGYSDNNNLKYIFKSSDITNQVQNNQIVMSDNPVKLISNYAIQPIEYEDSDGNIIKRNNNIYNDVYGRIGQKVIINQLPDALKRQGYSIDSSNPISLTLKNTSIASEVRPQVDMMTPCIIHLNQNKHYGAHLKVEYLNQNGQQVGYTDVISGNVGEKIDVTNPENGGEIKPNNYEFDNNVKKIYTLRDGLTTVYLHVNGDMVKPTVTINAIETNSNGSQRLDSYPVQLKHAVRNGNIVTLHASDYAPSGYNNDNNYSNISSVQINNATTNPNVVTFHYQSKQTQGAPIAVHYVNQDGQIVKTISLTGNNGTNVVNKVNQSDKNVIQNEIPKGYQQSSTINNLDFTHLPQDVNVQVQGKSVTQKFTVREIIKGYGSDSPLQISNQTFNLSGNVGDSALITPYRIQTNGQNPQSDQLITGNYHSQTQNSSLRIRFNSDKELTPLNDITYLYQEDYPTNNIDTIRIHYTTDSNVANVGKKSDGELTDGSEVDMESDHNTNNSSFNIAPYLEDIPTNVSDKNYDISDTTHLDSHNSDIIQGSNVTKFTNNVQDIYIRVHQLDNHQVIIL